MIQRCREALDFQPAPLNNMSSASADVTVQTHQGNVPFHQPRRAGGVARGWAHRVRTEGEGRAHGRRRRQGVRDLP